MVFLGSHILPLDLRTIFTPKGTTPSNLYFSRYVKVCNTHVYIFVVNKVENTDLDEEVNGLKKMMFIVARLVPDPEVYEGKTNAEIAKEIQAEMPVIPYVARIEKVTVLDAEG